MKQITLPNGEVVQVCDCHYYLVKDTKWHLQRGYAIARGKADGGSTTIVFMHRVINNTPDGTITDHIDRNKLNNQCKNLRNASISLNNSNRPPGATNTSSFTGVDWSKKDKVWRARIKHYGKEQSLGSISSLGEAMLVRAIAEL
jgi:hypothetical protein